MTRSQRGKIRADELLVMRGIAPTRSKARAFILAGDVRSGDRVIQKAGELIDPERIELELVERPRYVSRGGFKLEHALDSFDFGVERLIAADIGASTGGFTHCLLQRGVARVYAIDVGYGQLDYRLRIHDQVVVMERVNARYLEDLPERPDLVVIDVSFISLRHIIPVADRLLASDGSIIMLIKPQFEAGRDRVGKNGVIRDDAIRRDVVQAVMSFAIDQGLRPKGLTRSPVIGSAGNEEFLAWLSKSGHPENLDHLLELVFSRNNRG